MEAIQCMIVMEPFLCRVNIFLLIQNSIAALFLYLA